MAETPEGTDTVAPDELRTSILDRLMGHLGDAVVGHHMIPGTDLWVRVAPEAWVDAGKVVRSSLGCRSFGFLSAIDWMPSPYGRSMGSEVDAARGAAEEAVQQAVAPESDGAQEAAPEPPPVTEPDPAGTGFPTGCAGGDTRFQVFARVGNISEHWGITLKVDVGPDEAPAIDSWVSVYAGADWHEREAWEMYGITFVGHPGLRHLYLPGEFRGNPMRKDFPLLARIVKPWPGIVDTEPMPATPDADADASTTPAVEEAS